MVWQGEGMRSLDTGHAHRPIPEGGAAAALRERPALQFAHFRTWHDRATVPQAPTCMSELPPQLDLAFVFPNETPPESPFWETLREEYVPRLHEQGTAVARTVDVGRILDPAFPDSPAGRRANAEHLVETVVRAHGLDGLDVDMERRLTPAQADRAAAVFAELGRHLGRASGNGSLLIYDTNLDGDEPVFAASAALFDYVLEQSYGRDPRGLEATWATFAPHIPPSRYLIGFSYYEEFDRNLWDDASEPFEDSRAVAYADWQPSDGPKAGIFSYAVDRDGAPFLNDTVRRTDYGWTRRLGDRLRV